MRPLPPLEIPWIRKPLSSAETSVTVLPTGQIKLWIRHQIIRGVTPAMLVWWFKHLEGTIEIAGQTVSRYRAWHPIDHYAVTYHRRCADGSIGPGAILHIQEFFGGNPEWKVDVLTRIVKLDETGFVHEPRRAGIVIGRMEYEFEAVEGGTRYTNWLIAGTASPLGRIVNPLVRRVAFSDPQARAWLTHNIEEVGNFESFLPGLYAQRDD